MVCTICYGQTTDFKFVAQIIGFDADADVQEELDCGLEETQLVVRSIIDSHYYDNACYSLIIWNVVRMTIS